MHQTPLAILVVEDDRSIAALVQDALMGAGYRVEVVAEAPAALRALATTWPDVLLLNPMLRDLGGIDVCAEVRLARPLAPYLPILVLAAPDARAYRDIACACGADDYIDKPIDVAALRAQVHEWGCASRGMRLAAEQEG
jgi:DNA-binding response OmpR family regulator